MSKIESAVTLARRLGRIDSQAVAMIEQRDAAIRREAEERIAQAEAQVAELRAALQDQCVLIDGEHCYCIGTFDGVHDGRCDAIRAALARTPAEALARQPEDAPGCAACGFNLLEKLCDATPEA